MPSPAKYPDVISVIERRIRNGDYLLNSIPSERRIAEETGVSYMTARRAVLELLQQQVLIRGSSGFLEVHPDYAKQAGLAEVVLLYPAYASTYLTHLRSLVSDFAKVQEIGIRPVQFIHWDEVTLLEAVDQARGTLIIPPGQRVPTRLLDPLRKNRVVILDGDFSEHEVPSIRLFADSCIESVFQHLADLGHRRVDCLNTQNHDTEINRRIALWRGWLQQSELAGDLWDDPAPPFANPKLRAYDLMCQLLDNQNLTSKAIVGTTCSAAIGAIRACWERGVGVGRDISICTINIEPDAECFCPAITGLSTPDLTDVLGACFEWFFDTIAWKGPVLMEPQASSLFIGESTGVTL